MDPRRALRAPWIPVAAVLATLAGCGQPMTEPGAAPVSDTDATTYRIGPAQTNATTERVAPPLARRWSWAQADVAAPALVMDRRVFVFFYDGAGVAGLRARRLGDGGPAWSRSLPSVPHEIAAGAGRVFTLSQAGVVTSRDARTGARRWQRSVATSDAYSFSEAPTYAAGSLFLVGGGRQATVFALDATTGRTRWSRRVNGSGATPTVRDGTVYLSFDGPQIYALDARTGQARWHRGGFPHGGGWSGVAATSDRVFAGQRVLTLGWRLRDVAGTGWVTVAGGSVVTLERDGVHAARLSDLRHRWLRRPPGTAVSEHVVVSDGVVWSTDSLQGLSARSLGTGELLWRTTTADRAFAITVAGNRLVLTAREGVTVYGE